MKDSLVATILQPVEICKHDVQERQAQLVNRPKAVVRLQLSTLTVVDSESRGEVQI